MNDTQWGVAKSCCALVRSLSENIITKEISPGSRKKLQVSTVTEAAWKKRNK